MFEGLFDFGKKRSLKQSIGFFIFHGGLAVVVLTMIKLLGASS